MAEPLPESPQAPRESTSPPSSPLRSEATYAVVVLTLMNLLNYVDRWVPSAVKEDFKRELQLTDAQTSYPLTGLVIVYMICSPIFGSLSDRWPRKWVIAVGVGLWSLATGAAYFAVGFWSFLITRALVGVGEAAYATLAPALLSDFFAPARRNRILTGFYVAIPVGSALGFALGGIIGQHYGWRVAFLACGLPGILVALLGAGLLAGRLRNRRPDVELSQLEAERVERLADKYTGGDNPAIPENELPDPGPLLAHPPAVVDAVQSDAVKLVAVFDLPVSKRLSRAEIVRHAAD